MTRRTGRGLAFSAVACALALGLIGSAKAQGIELCYKLGAGRVEKPRQTTIIVAHDRLEVYRVSAPHACIQSDNSGVSALYIGIRNDREKMGISVRLPPNSEYAIGIENGRGYVQYKPFGDEYKRFFDEPQGEEKIIGKFAFDLLDAIATPDSFTRWSSKVQQGSKKLGADVKRAEALSERVGRRFHPQAMRNP